MSTKLVYGFTIPKKVWNEINNKDILKEEIINSMYIFKTETELKKYNFIISEFADSETVILGLNICAFDEKHINRLELNDLNMIFNKNINDLQAIFSKVFELIITKWAEIVKKTADELIKMNNLISEKVEIPTDIEIPTDLKVEWFIVSDSINK